MSRASVLLRSREGTKELEFLAGLVGMEQNGLELRPKMGWVVQDKSVVSWEWERNSFRPELRGRLPAREKVSPPRRKSFWERLFE